MEGVRSQELRAKIRISSRRRLPAFGYLSVAFFFS